MVLDLMEKIRNEITGLLEMYGRDHVTWRTVQTATRIALPGDLVKHAISEATKHLGIAIDNWGPEWEVDHAETEWETDESVSEEQSRTRNLVVHLLHGIHFSPRRARVCDSVPADRLLNTPCPTLAAAQRDGGGRVESGAGHRG